MMRLATIRWKLFVLITCAVALPIACLTVYFPATRIAALQDALGIKALSFSRMLVDQTRSAIAFDDSETAREAFAAVTTDADVLFAALYRADGTLLASTGSQGRDAPTVADQLVVSREDDRVRVSSPVVSREGPRGTLVLELSTAAAKAEGARTRRVAMLVGLVALLIGCCGAWVVGRSFGRRVRRIMKESERVAHGDLSESPPVDISADEIGQMALAFQTMVKNLKVAYASIEQQVGDRTEALRASNEQTRALLETTDAVPWAMEVVSWRFTYMGPQASGLFGLPADAWQTFESWSNHVDPQDLGKVVESLIAVAADQKERVAEFRVQRPDGRRLWVRMLVSATPPAGSKLLRGFMFDVTERVEMEIELRQAQKLESVGRLASGIAHEINTPVQFVSDSVHFVRDCLADVLALLNRYRALRSGTADPDQVIANLKDLEQADEDVDLDYLIDNGPKAVDRALEGLGRVATIVRSMKEFAHPDQQGKTDANINNALATTIIIARNEYKDVAHIETDFCPDLPLVSCHIGELNQAFLNIIVNAAHAIADVGGADAAGTIRITTRKDGEEIVVEVSDSGGGIPEEIRGRIFDLFFTTKEVGRGTGQGLAIAYRSVVERHGGSLTFRSEMGRGTTFVIRLPIGSPARSDGSDATVPAPTGWRSPRPTETSLV